MKEVQTLDLAEGNLFKDVEVAEKETEDDLVDYEFTFNSTNREKSKYYQAFFFVLNETKDNHRATNKKKRIVSPSFHHLFTLMSFNDKAF